MSDVDVVIIGAGAAGLSAAKVLRERGLTYAVVEGSHRIGGRAYAEEIAPGVWFDLGCSYLHQGATNPFVPIADDLGIPLNREHADMFDGKIRAYRNGSELSDEERARYQQYQDEIDAAILASAAAGEDRPIAAFVDMESAFFTPFAAGMAALNTMDIDETSTADYARFVEGYDGEELDIPVPGGFGNLVKTWGSDIEVSLNSRVEAIDWSDHDVAVETVKGTVRGRAALVTVSTGILASSSILFRPRLPDWKIESYVNVPTGTENKICLHFDTDVFGPDGLGFHMTWNDAGDAAGFEASVNGNNTAIVFTGGRHALWLEKQGQQAGHDFAVDRVAEVFGNGIRKHVTRSIVTAWASEPWTLGSYSAPRPGQAHQRVELAKPLDDRLFFAGEATSVSAMATCHGAYLSGIRAADEIAAALG